MKVLLTCLASVTLLFGGSVPVAGQQEMQRPRGDLTGIMDVGPQHDGLQTLVGRWNTAAELRLGPGEPLQRSEGTEVVTPLGGLWISAMTTGTHVGEPYHGALTLGYDPRQETYVGSYVDAQCNHLWTYRGSMNEDGTVLTLETEGPALDGSPRIARFKEVHEFKGENERTRTSYVHHRGRWVPYATVHFQRQR